MVSYGLFSISLKRARIRSAVVSRGDICNPRTPFTLVSSTKYIAEPSIPPYTGCQHQQPPDRGYRTKRGAEALGGGRPLDEPSHTYQMWGSGELYELLWE